METLLHIAGLYLAQDNSAGYGPLDLSLAAGEGALITCADLDVLRLLMRTCLGEGQPEGGTISWWTEHSPEDAGWAACDFYRRIGYVDRHSQLLSNMTLLDNLLLRFTYALTEREAAESRARDILKTLGLAAYEQSQTDYLLEPQRRLALYALALCGQPRLLLMERPRQFLDNAFQQVWDMILGLAQSGLASIVFDRSAANYDTNDFSLLIDFPGRV